MKWDNRIRIIVCLVATVVILAAAPFFFPQPVAAEPDLPELVASFEPEPEPLPLPEASLPSVEIPNTAPEPIAERLTNQHYIEPLVAEGSINVIICAPDPSAWNMDTIVIASMDPGSSKLTLISLPRDIYIKYSDALIQRVDDIQPGLVKQAGMEKINAVHAIGDKLHYKEGVGRFDRPYIEFLADVIEEVFDVHIDDYIYMQTRGFRRIVDYFGGVKVYVPIRMFYEDPTQDLFINLQKGSQLLEGYQAEGFVRFRQGFDDAGNFNNYGDLFRKENQTKFFRAFLQQHLTLRNLSRLSDISDFIGKNIITSIKGWDKIVDYGAKAETFLSVTHSIESEAIKGSEGRLHGLSYVFIEERDTASD